MQKNLASGLILCGLMNGIAFAAHADDKPDWKIYSDISLYGYSEPVSIDQFARDFHDDLEGGDTAFTHNSIEVGGSWKGFRIAAVSRFDYITEFTEDTALVHHSDKNNITLPENRDYDLLLDVERVRATGFKIGYEWNFYKGMTVDVAYSHYSDLSDLQSGYASAYGDLEPFTDAVRAEAQAVIDSISAGNRDLSELQAIAQNVNADILIDYAYDDPKFGEEEYREPNITGPQNPVISGINFSEPDGTGYSFDLGFNWVVNERLDLNVQLWDIKNEFKWDQAPQTYASFDLNAFLIDAIAQAQELLNGGIVVPNDLIDEHLFVNIRNADYKQELPWRGDFEVHYDLDKELNVFGWTPAIGVLGGVYHTDTQDFPRLGVTLDRNIEFYYDIGGEAFSASWEAKYGFIRLITSSFDLKDANTFGFSAGLRYQF